MIYETPALTDQEIEVILHIDEVREKLSYALSSPRRWTGLLRRDAFARAIQGSNTIEGYNVTIDDAVAAAENDEPLDATDLAWAAVTCYRDALTYILQLSDDPHFEYSEALVRSLHYMLLKYDLSKRPGQWRPGPIQVVDERRKKVVYTGPDNEALPQLMRELIVSLDNGQSNIPVLIKAAMAHLNLAMIHPFSDGNGRMARALQTLVLAREGVISPVFSSIEEYLGRNQEDYYRVLATVGQGKWHPENDARPWIRFCLTAHYRCAITFLRRTKEIELVWNQIELIRKRFSLPERVEAPLVMAAFGRRIRNSNYRMAAEVSDQIASRDLKKLTDNGMLVPTGEKRGRVYTGGRLLKAVRRNAVQPHCDNDDPFELPQRGQPNLPGFDD